MKIDNHRKSLHIAYDAQNFAVDDEGVPRFRYRMWQKPEPDRKYGLGADPSEGLDNGDDSCLCILSDLGEQCFSFAGQIDPDEFGLMVNMAGTFYNNAYVGVENNKIMTPIEVLQHLGYQNMHYEWVRRGQPTPERKEKLGWNTNAITRPILIDQARKGLKDGYLWIRDKMILDQMALFERDKRGKYQAIVGAKDDAIFAWMIAVQMIQFMWVADDLRAEGLLPRLDNHHLGDTDIDMLSEIEDEEDVDLFEKSLRRMRSENAETTMGGMSL